MTSAIWKEPVDRAGLARYERPARRPGRRHEAAMAGPGAPSSCTAPTTTRAGGRNGIVATSARAGSARTSPSAALQESIVCLGDRFEVGEALIEVTSPRAPCWKLARRHGMPDLVEVVKANHRHGWYLRVLRTGWIEAGQAVKLVDRPYPQWTIDRAGDVRWGEACRPEEARLLSQCPALIPDWREKLAARAS